MYSSKTKALRELMTDGAALVLSTAPRLSMLPMVYPGGITRSADKRNNADFIEVSFASGPSRRERRGSPFLYET